MTDFHLRILALNFKEHISKVKKLLDGRDVKTPIGIKIISCNFIAKALTIATNKCLTHGFVSNKRITSTTSLGKGETIKCEISNYQLVSISNTFSNICEKEMRY